MKTLVGVLLVALSVTPCFAQIKGARDYFPKNYQPPPPGGQRPPPNNQTPPPTNQPPATAALPKFKELSVNSQFYFLADTNRAYAWTKLSATTAKNTKNNVTATINPETPIQR